MASSTTQPTSKSAKKKAAAKVQALERTQSPAPSTASGAAGTGDDSESPYIKELQKNIRNFHKKIANVHKTEELLKEHAGKSLDDLLAAKVINADQKAQVQKKPALEAQLAQTEEQVTQYQKIDEQYRTRAAADKTEWEKKLQAAKDDKITETGHATEQDLRQKLLTVSQFLRLAAYRREEGADPESDESQAIEGVLLAIYTGDENAVNAMLKLVDGSSDKVVSVPGEQLQTDYLSVKTLAQEYKSPFETESGAVEGGSAHEVVTDPTLANATVNELAAENAASAGAHATEPVANGLSNAQVSDDAANAVAESHWDTGNDMSGSQEWVDVKVPQDAADTGNGVTATPAAANIQSWADDHPDPASAPTAAPANPDDGFHQVQRNKGRAEGGGFRGGRGRGEWRGGRGHRGDGRGRGRGNRGSGVPSRGARRNDES